MAPATAEKLHTQWGIENEQPLRPDAYLAHDLERDYESRRTLMRVLGAVTLDAAIMNQEKQAAETASLARIAKDYFSEDSEKARNAKARLSMDFRKNVFEILCDEGQGHISESTSEYKGDGFYQYGYNQRAIFAYGVQHATHPVERNRRGIETLNEIRIEDGYRQGLAKEYYYVEISRKPLNEEMPEKTAADIGYYRTARVMLRLTEVDKEGNRVTETMAVSGVDKNGERYDDKGVTNIYQSFQLEAEEQTPTGILQAAFWVRKDALPNRSASLAELYDKGLEGDTFCGVQKQEADYESLLEESRAREKQVDEELSKRVYELAVRLVQAKPEEQLKVMAGYAKDFAAELCAEHKEYSPEQFGPIAAAHIEETRFYMAQNNYEAARQSLQNAKETAVVSMCGMQFKANRAGDNSPSGSGPDTGQASNPEGSCPEVKDGQVTNCPFCKKKVRAIVKGREKIYCSNAKCEAAAPEVKKAT
jgi:hypothetical protein